MEEALNIKYKMLNVKPYGMTYANQGKYAMARYADDFVIMCETETEAKEIYDILIPYLNKRGLELSMEKTTIKNNKNVF